MQLWIWFEAVAQAENWWAEKNYGKPFRGFKMRPAESLYGACMRRCSEDEEWRLNFNHADMTYYGQRVYAATDRGFPVTVPFYEAPGA